MKEGAASEAEGVEPISSHPCSSDSSLGSQGTMQLLCEMTKAWGLNRHLRREVKKQA